MGLLVCRVLANLAGGAKRSGSRGKRMVMASIHCPSGRMLRSFSHLLVLTQQEGRVAFHGPTAQAEAFFTAALGGRARPPELNAAEFLLDAVSDLCVDDGEGHKEEEEGEGEEGQAIKYLLVPSDAPARVASAFNDARLHRVSLPGGLAHARPPACGSTARAPFATLLRANLWRAGLEVQRTPVVAGVLLCNALVVGTLFGGLYYQQVVSSWRNTMCMVLALMVSGCGLLHFPWLSLENA